MTEEKERAAAYDKDVNKQMDKEINSNPYNAGKSHQTEIDKAMETAREAQHQEQVSEQARMERMHVATMAMSGILASNAQLDAKSVAKMAVKHADKLLREIAK